ncbi:hypothetical protein SORBI_3001G458500 [Sorghum bicolor]|uniref:Uncharacterized protein n=1 Tax=Sorghum bicolor TaxID=4558 RepID=A0A1B6QPN6_SORBI|nr:hypothetical protein SORBI_3001G458500 [Sorghum bicolor]
MGLGSRERTTGILGVHGSRAASVCVETGCSVQATRPHRLPCPCVATAPPPATWQHRRTNSSHRVCGMPRGGGRPEASLLKQSRTARTATTAAAPVPAGGLPMPTR